MHILATTSSQIAEGIDPVDPDQKPADLVFLSTADTDLSVLSQASRHFLRNEDFLRLGQLAWLSQPYSVDLYLEKTATRSRLVILRVLGGLSYWQYCLEQFSSRMQEARKTVIILPGDDKPDAELLALSNIDRLHWENLFGYLVEGGLTNARNFLHYARHILYGEPCPPLPSPELKNGLYHPHVSIPDLSALRSRWTPTAPIAALIFYRALHINGNIKPIDALINTLQAKGINPLPVYVSSLKDAVANAYLDTVFVETVPDIILNLTSFALSTNTGSSDWAPTILDKVNKPVFQVCLGSNSLDSWLENTWGLPPRDIAMSVSLPELDGRIFTRSIAFKDQSPINPNTQHSITFHEPVTNRVDFVAQLAKNWIRLGATPPGRRKVALILANYPNKDGRIANGVGLDTPQSVVNILHALITAGYEVSNPPNTSRKLMDLILAGPTNNPARSTSEIKTATLEEALYKAFWRTLPGKVKEEIESRWGPCNDDPLFRHGEFMLPLHRFGNVALGVQPARGYNIDPKETYHSPDLVPPHNYLAFYFWLRHVFAADAIIHVGKHGNLEWLPGKALALSENCFAEAVLGPTPHFYPFIINDPGEGTQAKRRSQAVIVDHLTPPLTRAESYGIYLELERLVDEYYAALGVDRKRALHLQGEILDILARSRLEEDIGIRTDDAIDRKLVQLDAYLCEIKERQIRDGLHIFGSSPHGVQERDLLASLVRIPRQDGKGHNASFLRSLANDLDLMDGFDPLDCDPAARWQGKRPEILNTVGDAPWRTNGDTVERLELLFASMLDGTATPPHATRQVWDYTKNTLQPRLESCGQLEIDGLLNGLNGHFVPPGPSGAPTRGRADILPTGRNFYSVDSRSLPTRTAWKLGWKSASLLVDRFVQDHGDWPRCLGLTAWGTSNMRTGGDDIAQALALMGIRPKWDDHSGRVTGFEIIPATALGRPRVDVTLRVSGFFRDAFPFQVDLIAQAARAVMKLDEPGEQNPAVAAYQRDSRELGDLRASYRVFGSKPGSYGAGLQALIDERLWNQRSQLGEAYHEWGSYPLGETTDGRPDRESFALRLSQTEVVVQNQDNHEHDILDSDDYYQFEGGMAAAVEKFSGDQPVVYHNDHSRPERPVIRTLDEEIGRVVRARAANPKWIAGVKRHGYKGAFEIAATVDYLFAFAATTGAAKSHHFDITFAAYIEDDATRQFIKENNPDALSEILSRYREALDRNLWIPRSNSTRSKLFELLESSDVE